MRVRVIQSSCSVSCYRFKTGQFVNYCLLNRSFTQSINSPCITCTLKYQSRKSDLNAHELTEIIFVSLHIRLITVQHTCRLFIGETYLRYLPGKPPEARLHRFKDQLAVPTVHCHYEFKSSRAKWFYLYSCLREVSFKAAYQDALLSSLVFEMQYTYVYISTFIATECQYHPYNKKLQHTMFVKTRYL